MGDAELPSYHAAMRFERRIAAIYRTLGASVEHNVVLAGNQIDILITEETRAGAKVRSAIECKYFSRHVGINVVNAFAGLASLLRERRLIHKAIIVSNSGFTPHARTAAQEHSVELLEAADLERRVHGKDRQVSEAESEAAREEDEAANDPERPPAKWAFVVMPFSKELNDVYVLGIREVAEKLGIVVLRADGIEHNQNIPQTIKKSIAKCNVVIAETSQPNLNVFYEVGLAHGLDKQTILICRDAKSIPFDLSVVNHLIYSNIVDLRDKLESRLIATLDL